MKKEVKEFPILIVMGVASRKGFKRVISVKGGRRVL